jgi:S1-C subfamily serine protease
MCILRKSLSLLLFLYSLVINSESSDIFNESNLSVVAILGEHSMGSGVIISDDGYVLTNWHVIENEKDFKVLTLGKGGYEENLRDAEVIKFSMASDLALIKLKTFPANMQVAKLSRVIPNVGDAVHAIGHPHGEIWSYSKGYISAYREDYSWEINNKKYRGDVYQMQTPINPGNSGGPLLNDHGNVVGINTFINTRGQGIAYAVTVKEIIKLLNS